MDAPYYNGEPGACPYDREYDERREPDDEPATCADCGTSEDVTHSTPVNGGRQHCDPCWRWRARHGYEFDPRPIQLLAKDLA